MSGLRRNARLALVSARSELLGDVARSASVARLANAIHAHAAMAKLGQNAGTVAHTVTDLHAVTALHAATAQNAGRADQVVTVNVVTNGQLVRHAMRVAELDLRDRFRATTTARSATSKPVNRDNQ